MSGLERRLRRRRQGKTGGGRESYLRQIAVAWRLGLIHPAADGISHVFIHHDDGCPRLDGTGECTCSPEVEIRAPKPEELAPWGRGRP